MERRRFPAEYAPANRVQHPVNVHLREDQLIGEVTGWLAREFAPYRLRATLAGALRLPSSVSSAAGSGAGSWPFIVLRKADRARGAG